MSNKCTQTENFEFEALKYAENYRNRLVSEFSPYLNGDVIEVGAGIGQITVKVAALSSVKSVLAVEPNSEFCRIFREHHPDIPLHFGTVNSLQDGSCCDSIVSINVLEHINEHSAELARYAQILSPRKGRLCLFVPARPEIYAPIDKDFGHFRRYVKADLSKMFFEAGFTVIRLEYFNVVGYFAWWFNFCVLKKRGFDTRAVRAFDRLIFPVTSTVEGWFPAPPFGQSILVVAEAK